MVAKKKAAPKKVAKKQVKKVAKKAVKKVVKAVKKPVKKVAKKVTKKPAKAVTVKPVADKYGKVTVRSVDDAGDKGPETPPATVKPYVDENGVLIMVPDGD